MNDSNPREETMPDDTLERSTTTIAVYHPPKFLMPTSIQAVKELAKMYCEADWVPKAYRDREGRPVPAKVEVGIMHGLELGLRPLAALQSIAVINGMPCVWGDGMLGLVRDSGLLEDIEENYEGQGDELAAICAVRRKGQQTPTVGRFTVAMAKKAGLWEKQGPWQGYPSRMLRMRARSWALRDGFADVLRGIRSAEEVLDMGDLVEEGGAYVPGNRPARPASSEPQTVTDVEEKPKAEPYHVAMSDSAVIECSGASEAATLFQQAMEAAGKISGKAVEGLWESNAMLLAELRERDKGKVADMLGDEYAAILKDTEARERKAAAAEKKAAAKPKDESKKVETPQVTTTETAAAEARLTWTPATGTMPTSPLKGGNWIAFLPRFVEELRAIPNAQVPDFLSAENYGPIYDYLAAKRPDDKQEIDKILAAKKKGV